MKGASPRVESVEILDGKPLNYDLFGGGDPSSTWFASKKVVDVTYHVLNLRMTIEANAATRSRVPHHITVLHQTPLGRIAHTHCQVHGQKDQHRPPPLEHKLSLPSSPGEQTVLYGASACFIVHSMAD